MITKAFMLFLFILLLISGDASILDWFWGGAQENAGPRIKIGDVPIAKVPFEINTEGEKFLQAAKKYTSLKLSDLDDCQHRVVLNIHKTCSDLREEELAKMSVNLLNCQSAVEGRQHFPLYYGNEPSRVHKFHGPSHVEYIPSDEQPSQGRLLCCQKPAVPSSVRDDSQQTHGLCTQSAQHHVLSQGRPAEVGVTDSQYIGICV
jgi:hypothetical protein